MAWTDKLKIAAALVAALFVASLVLSPDSWDRIKDWLRSWWRPEPELPPSNRVMPWELEKQQRRADAERMQSLEGYAGALDINPIVPREMSDG